MDAIPPGYVRDIGSSVGDTCGISVNPLSLDLFRGAATMMNDLVRLIEALGALDLRVVALLVIALGLAAVAYIATR